MANLSPIGRVSFPSVFRPTAMDEDKEPKYQVSLVFDPEKMDKSQKELFQKMVAAANAVCVEKFGCKLGEANAEGKRPRSPFRKTDEKPQYYEPGQIFVKFTNRTAPNVVDRARRAITEGSGDFYAGCWAHLSFTVYGYNKKGNCGVAFGLCNIQKIKDDEAFGAPRTSAEDDFEAYEDGADDIPF